MSVRFTPVATLASNRLRAIVSALAPVAATPPPLGARPPVIRTPVSVADAMLPTMRLPPEPVVALPLRSVSRSSATDALEPTVTRRTPAEAGGSMTRRVRPGPLHA